MAAHVEIDGLTKRFADVTALAGVDLTVEAGHLLAVLGPSGCGKTTLLRIVAGFERADAGWVSLAGREVDGACVVPPHRRGVAVVPQEGALFPHLRVGENVGFGLPRGRESARRGQAGRELVGLVGLEKRYPHELSGGQQQRVAVARALAPRPTLVLLDEPFAALDAALRADLRADVRAALAEDHATALLVTHDQEEALSIADEVAVMRDGRVRQCAAPELVYRQPVDPWVASFVGEATVFRARVRDGIAATVVGNVPVLDPARGTDSSAGPDRSVLVRPEQVILGDHGTQAVVSEVTYYGHDATVVARLLDGTPIIVRVQTGHRLPVVGQQVQLRIEGAGHVLADDPDATPRSSGLTGSRG